jgi:putative transcriptional regulator
MAIQLRLRELLKRRGLTQTELQLRTGLGYSSINAMFHGKTQRVEFATLDSLCEALNCKVGDLLEYVPDKNKGRS